MKRLFLLVGLLGLLSGCAPGDISDTIYLKHLEVDGVDITGEFIPPAVYGRWTAVTINNAPTAMSCNGIVGHYFSLAPNSAVSFRLMITARDSTGDIASWRIDNGLIRRAGNNTTTLITSTTVTTYRDDIAWEVTITGLPAEDALNITVIGDTINPTYWSAVLYGAEVHI